MTIHAVKANIKPHTTTIADLQLGQCMVVEDLVYNGYNGLILMKGRETTVCLSDPERTWGNNSPLVGRLVPKGTTITMVVGR